eukprot:TRINITY_DN12059_c0_g2_i3.p1 TRINITY_DN12059_c0_g2~~TRINITY_DN12059_c0_g2_i3.p1  ORF type:complete len:129 (+),score=11.02 TRINITY_DN12059_c0_g2_i3:60-389(+)
MCIRDRLKRLPLVSLRLELGRSNIKDEGMKALAESIRCLSQLENLTISFSAEKGDFYTKFPLFTFEGTQHLANAISILTTLRTLQLGFHRFSASFDILGFRFFLEWGKR